MGLRDMKNKLFHKVEEMNEPPEWEKVLAEEREDMETAADEYQKEEEDPDAVGLEESRKAAQNVDIPQTKLNLDATKEYAVIVDDVVKVFGEEQVLKHVSHAFERGKVHGIIGNNGSGKTVMLKCICGFMKPTTGRVLVHGKEIGKDVDFPDDIGIIIESPGFLPTKTGFRNLQILASLKGKIGREEIIRTIERVGLDPALKKPVSKYSLGMRQRLGIAQAIMEDPDLLILDEPFNGLDKYGVEDIRKIIQDLKELNKTILLVSHNGEDIRLLCDTVCEMDAGILREVYHDEEE